jgi:glycosyltransferase involved in cell wall biosynthesis
MRPLYRFWMYRWIEEYGTDFLAPSKASLASFWGTNWQTDPRKRVLHLGLSVERFRQPGDRAALRAELGLPPEARLILNVGRFIPSKRQAFLVDVARQVAARRRDVYFVFIGSGPLQEEVERMVNTLGLSNRVRFVPAQPGIERFWLAADIFAFPSVSEGFGIVVVEAAAAGLPIVVHDIPGVREAAHACTSITLLPMYASVEDWARNMLDTLDRPRLSEDERLRMLDRFPFAIEASVGSLKHLYGIDAIPRRAVGT